MAPLRPVHTARPAVSVPSSPRQAALIKALRPLVDQRVLTAADQHALVEGVAQRDVIGPFAARRAGAQLKALGAADQQRVRTALDSTPTPLHRAFVLKEIAAGSAPADVVSFEKAIRRFSTDEVMTKLTVARSGIDAAGTGVEGGLVQEFANSCVATVAQTLEGLARPSFALKLRTENQSLSEYHLRNPQMTEHQAAIMESVGVAPERRGPAFRQGVPWDTIDTVYNTLSAQTGVSFERVAFDRHDPAAMKQALDTVVAQLRDGIATPLTVGGEASWRRDNHAVIAVDTFERGGETFITVSNPRNGSVRDIARSKFEMGLIPGGSPVFGAYHRATVR